MSHCARRSKEARRVMSYTSSAPGVVSCATDGLQMAARMEKCDAMTAMFFAYGLYMFFSFWCRFTMLPSHAWHFIHHPIPP